MRESKSTTSVADGEEGKEKEKKVRGPRGGKKVKSAAAAAVVETAAAIPAGSDVGAPPPPPPPGAPTDGSRLDDGAPPPAPPLVDTPYLRETIAANHGGKQFGLDKINRFKIQIGAWLVQKQ